MNPFKRIACIIAALTLLGACSREVSVKIGVAAPMSGPLAQYGKDIAHGAEVAVDELNKDFFMIDGKRARFELAIEDDKAVPAEGKIAAKRLIDAKVQAVFGHFNSGVTIAAAPLYAGAGIPQLSVSTNPKYTRMGLKTAFRITADDIAQGAALGHLIQKKLRPKSVYLVDDGTLFGAGLAAEVSKALTSGKIAIQHDSIDGNSADFALQAQKIIESSANIVFFGGDEATGMPLLKALRKAGSSAKYVAGDAMCDASTIKHAEGSGDNDFYCSLAGVPPSWLSAGIAFTELYKTRFGVPGAYSALAYDGIHLFAQAMQRANSTEPKVYLPEISRESFNGKIQGSLSFDDKGDIRDGTIVIFESINGTLTEQRNML
ncbi:MAG: branched-chain amino acid ABC transporter substrate-binding protein [Oxalobacteraceae bacterium]|nr:branched-chain amino acid ABC transporter substrate-binding protein [Oxalobacteraceae bacterium]